MHSCADGLLWNQQHQTCDWAVNVECNSEPTEPPVTTSTTGTSAGTSATTESTTEISNEDTSGTTATTSTTAPPSSSSKVVVCYFTNWAQYRTPASVQQRPRDLPADLCTHIVYSFAQIPAGQNTLATYEWNDVQMYAEMMTLKQTNPDLKVIIVHLYYRALIKY